MPQVSSSGLVSSLSPQPVIKTATRKHHLDSHVSPRSPFTPTTQIHHSLSPHSDAPFTLNTNATSNPDDVATTDIVDWKAVDLDLLSKHSCSIFRRALESAERSLMQRGSNGEDETDQTETADDENGELETVQLEKNAFEQWAHRISHLSILNVDEALRDDPSTLPRLPSSLQSSSADPHVRASLALSLTGDPHDPQTQLMRLRVLLAQEEAKNVELEDRVVRCDRRLLQEQSMVRSLQHALSTERARREELEREVHMLKAAESVSMSGSNADRALDSVDGDNNHAAEEVQKLQRHNALLSDSLHNVEREANALRVEMEKLRREVRRMDMEADREPEPALPSSPTTIHTNDDSSFPSLLHSSQCALIRLRYSLELARIKVMHQHELDHLLQYKISYLSQHTARDEEEEDEDEETRSEETQTSAASPRKGTSVTRGSSADSNSSASSSSSPPHAASSPTASSSSPPSHQHQHQLATLQSQLEAERSKHQHTRQILHQLQMEQESLQQVIASMAEQLHRATDGAGVNVQITTPPRSTPATAGASDQTNATTATNMNTPSRSQTDGGNNAAKHTKQANSSGGSSSWSSWVFGSSGKSKRKSQQQADAM